VKGDISTFGTGALPMKWTGKETKGKKRNLKALKIKRGEKTMEKN